MEYTAEMFAGNFIREVDPKVTMNKARNAPRLYRQVLLRCYNCDKEFIVDANNAKRTQQKCCSRTCSHRLTEEFEGGNERHPLYSRWLSMNQRCKNPNATNFINYGERGILIGDELKNFSDYVRTVTALPDYPTTLTKFTQLDRIDNSKGYELGNLRWVDMSIQAANQRKRKTTSNTYRGVHYSKRHGKWVSSITLKGVRYSSSTFSSEKDALEHTNAVIKKYGLPHPIQEWKG